MLLRDLQLKGLPVRFLKSFKCGLVPTLAGAGDPPEGS